MRLGKKLYTIGCYLDIITYNSHFVIDHVQIFKGIFFIKSNNESMTDVERKDRKP
jgi:hypothetical protein